MRRIGKAAIPAFVGALLATHAAAAAEDPAATRVETFCRAVLQTASRARNESPQAKAQHFRGLIEETFNLPVLAQFTVGETWSRLTPGERSGLLTALSNYTAARYAAEVDPNPRQHCEVDPNVVTRGPDKLVKTKVTDGKDADSVNYRLRAYDGAWKVIDVYYNGVSELATRRADLAGVLQSKGAPGAIAKLNELSSQLR